MTREDTIMWKKDEDTTQQAGRTARDSETPARSGAAASAPSDRTATIGSAIKIKGEVSGDEDLLIQGRVDGSIDLAEHAVTVGTQGHVTASIVASVVTVEGRVDGDIDARERIVLRSSSQVEGDITAPRVVLEDGARFRGGVDMGDAGSGGSSGSASSGSGNAKSTSSGTSAASSSSSSGSSKGSSSGSSRGGGSNGSKDSSSKREAATSASTAGKASAS